MIYMLLNKKVLAGPLVSDKILKSVWPSFWDAKSAYS